MSASIAGVARMIERIDLSSKRTGDNKVTLSSYLVETSDLTSKGKEVEQNAAAQPLTAISMGAATQNRSSSGVFPPNSTTIRGQVKVSCAQVHHLFCY